MKLALLIGIALSQIALDNPADLSDLVPPPPRPNEDVSVPVKPVSTQEKKSICKKYEGKTISYYDVIYRVKNCERIPISTDTFAIQRTTKLIEVDSDVIRALNEKDIAVTKSDKPRRCEVFNNRFISVNLDELYWIKSCRKQKVPDWATYEDMHGTSSRAILTVTPEELNQIRDSDKPLKSVLDDPRLANTKIAPEAEVLPIDVACKGLNGHFVSYYSQIYKIENCRKRVISDEDIIVEPKNIKTELTSSQWVSLPEGKPLEKKKSH